MVRLTLPTELYRGRHILSTVQQNHSLSRAEHVLFVHAHPDDETIATGGTIATLVDRGAVVTVLTCTRGERGEVIPVDIKVLEGDGPALAEHRTRELSTAMAVLGVDDHRFLGSPEARQPGLEPRRYLDSGMAWGESGAEALDELDRESLSAAEFGEVAADVAAVIASSGADAVVSYDSNGGYGHPDHILAHLAAVRAAEVMDVPFYSIVAVGDPLAPDDITVDVSAVLDRKTEALMAHRSQVTVDGDKFALSSGPYRSIETRESFRRMAAGPAGFDGWRQLRPTEKLVTSLLALGVGAAAGGICTVNHQLVLSLGAARMPLGVVVSLAIVAALLIGSRVVFGSRIPTSLAAVGVLGSLAVLTLGGAGGSVLVPANGAGYAWTYGATIIVAVVLAWPRITRSTASSPMRSTAEAPVQPTQDTIENAMESKGSPAP
ncbi:MAG: N-acetyl-D-myo-inositol-2-amino-2-deoxy-alpha-D-glucopyranoside deacetylase [Microbacteriaceae bacterium]|nr:N-acetyl-D-myo-inositol-2-amino-2-deoxy-alpha-D-glucopyranoside deacetylase [Microbacteriaceae bacterium]